MNSFRNQFPEAVRVIEQGIESRLHLGMQVYISRDGEPLANFALGEQQPGVPLTTETVMLWLSAGKPVTAVATLQLVERDLLKLDERVADYLPAFAAGGKETITLRQLLTHTAGFRHVDTGWPEATWDEIIARICETPLEEGWKPGARAGYHVASSWFILGELIRRTDGRNFADYVREEVFKPLEMRDSWNGMPHEEFVAYGNRIGQMYYRDRGTLELHDWHNELRCCEASPGGNCRGPIRELGHFYESLLFGEGSRFGTILQPETVTQMTTRQRVGMYDETFRHVVDFGLGVILDSNIHGAATVPYGYGQFCSASTFGHGGAQSSIGFADPANGLVVAFVANAMAGEGQHQRRSRSLNEAIYTDLGLTSLA